MMKHIVAAGALALMLGAVPSGAQAGDGFFTGNDLLSICEDTANGANPSRCLGYIIAISDALDGGEDSIAEVRACLPDGVTVGQIKDIAVAHLRNNPKYRHITAANLVAAALAKAFPC